MRVELVTREGCHVCDEAQATLEAAGVEVVPLDVDADAELLRLYDFRVPVVLRHGRVAAEGRISRADVQRILG